MARTQGYELSRWALDDLLRLTGQSITQLADLADVPRSTLSLLRKGHQRASVPVAHKIAKALDCDPRTLFPSLAASTEQAA